MSAKPAQQITANASDGISGMYRFIIPLRAMIRRRWAYGNVNTSMSNMVVAPNSAILLQRQLTLRSELIAQARAHGCRFVHDLDDLLWAIPPDNPNVSAFTPELLAAMEHQLRIADLVTVSTEPLAAALRSRGVDAVSVVPNVLCPDDWTAQPRRAQRSRIRVGWYGQRYVHASDLALLDDVVRALHREVDFVFFGDYPPALHDLAAQIEAHLPVPLALFPAMLAALDLDVLLAPLAGNAFNECKSNLRLLQAGMLGYAAIASDTPAHRELPVACIPNTAPAWIEAIRERAADVPALRREGETLRAAVHARFLIDGWIERYFAAWTGKPAPVAVLA